MLDVCLVICLLNSIGLIGASWMFYKKTKALETALAKSNPSRRKRSH